MLTGAKKNQFVVMVREKLNWERFDIKIDSKKNLVELPCLSGNHCNKLLTPEVYKEILTVGSSNLKADLQIWREWARLERIISSTDKISESKKIMKQIPSLQKRFLKHFTQRHSAEYITPYVHSISSHTGTLIERIGSLGLFSQQGFENLHKVRISILDN